MLSSYSKWETVDYKEAKEQKWNRCKKKEHKKLWGEKKLNKLDNNTKTEK